jgi:hypothetical protein
VGDVAPKYTSYVIGVVPTIGAVQRSRTLPPGTVALLAGLGVVAAPGAVQLFWTTKLQVPDVAEPAVLLAVTSHV